MSMDKYSKFSDYFEQWMETFKKPAISPVTYIKYENTLQHIHTYFGEIHLNDITRQIYQKALNEFSATHAKRTTSGFHKQIRASIVDALEEELITNDFTRKALITGRPCTKNKVAFHSYGDWQKLITSIYKSPEANDFIIYLAALTGLRFGEVLGLTVADIDFDKKIISINKTWDYKYHTGFKPTKNTSSIRTIDVDSKTLQYIKFIIHLRNFKQPHQAICTSQFNTLPVSATINRHLEKLCASLDIPLISFHGLRHTHASILLFKDVNIVSVSKRLGHRDVTTTQNIYLHIIKEMQDRETKLITNIMVSAFK